MKILITTKGGQIVNVASDTKEVTYAILDFDKNADYENDFALTELLEVDYVGDLTEIDIEDKILTVQLKEVFE